MPILSQEQEAAFAQAVDFVEAVEVVKPWFSLQGLSGTGKSFWLTELARRYGHGKMVAFTGNAASVLTRKSGLLATTIHSAIYEFLGEDDRGKPLFGPGVEDGAWRRRLIFLDESSNISHELAKNLIATGARIVACGDPGQLPPVKGERFFLHADATLTEVHRQAWDSPIIRQAHAVRASRGYRADGADFRVSRHVSREDILAADIVLCWRNQTRHALNALVRRHRDLPPDRLLAGEPVICLRNDHRKGFLNGASYDLLQDHVPGDGGMLLLGERGMEQFLHDAWVEEFEQPPEDQEEVPSWRRPLPFAIGRCCTVHKFQGSEVDSVILVDEYSRWEERDTFLYTGITRAAKRILIQPC